MASLSEGRLKSYPKDRAAKATAAQLEFLVETMRCADADFAAGRFSGSMGKERLKRSWEVLAKKLNSKGPARTPERWQRMWPDLKFKTRTKSARIKAAVAQTGNGPAKESLTELEKKILSIIGLETALGNTIPASDEDAAVDPLGDVSNNETDQLSLNPPQAIDPIESSEGEGEEVPWMQVAFLPPSKFMTDEESQAFSDSQSVILELAEVPAENADAAPSTTEKAPNTSTTPKRRRLSTAGRGYGSKNQLLSDLLTDQADSFEGLASELKSLLTGIKTALEKRNLIEEKKLKLEERRLQLYERKVECLEKQTWKA